MNTQDQFVDNPASVKRIILCADDYGQSAAISAGILQLVEQRRLSAVSCLTESDFWTHSGNALLEHREQIDIGLHFNLTHAFPSSPFPALPLNRVMGLALSGRIDRVQIVKTLQTQLDRFENIAKQIPDFVDGHQHVHVLPGIRHIVVGELEQRYGQKKPYLRAVNPRLSTRGDFIKELVLKLLGIGFEDLAQRHGMRTNPGFAGIYSLQPQADFAGLMQRWISAADNGDLLMCHPGARFTNHSDCHASDNSDPIAATRPRELAFLLSDEFAALLSRNAIRLSRFCDIQR